MDTLLDRIEQGMTTERDARVVSRLLARLAAYELTLREIAVYGSGHPAWLAAQALAKDHGEVTIAN
jgi:hypothetical protein